MNSMKNVECTWIRTKFFSEGEWQGLRYFWAAHPVDWIVILSTTWRKSKVPLTTKNWCLQILPSVVGWLSTVLTRHFRPGGPAGYTRVIGDEFPWIRHKVNRPGGHRNSPLLRSRCTNLNSKDDTKCNQKEWVGSTPWTNNRPGNVSGTHYKWPRSHNGFQTGIVKTACKTSVFACNQLASLIEKRLDKRILKGCACMNANGIMNVYAKHFFISPSAFLATSTSDWQRTKTLVKPQMGRRISSHMIHIIFVSFTDTSK